MREDAVRTRPATSHVDPLFELGHLIRVDPLFRAWAAAHMEQRVNITVNNLRAGRVGVKSLSRADDPSRIMGRPHAHDISIYISEAQPPVTVTFPPARQVTTSNT